MITVQFKESFPFEVSDHDAKLRKGRRRWRVESWNKKKKKKTKKMSLCFLTLSFLPLFPSGWRGMMMMRRRRPARGGAGHARRGWWAGRARSPADSQTVWSWPTATGDTCRPKQHDVSLWQIRRQQPTARLTIFLSSWGGKKSNKKEGEKRESCHCHIILSGWRRSTSSINNQHKFSVGRNVRTTQKNASRNSFTASVVERIQCFGGNGNSRFFYSLIKQLTVSCVAVSTASVSFSFMYSIYSVRGNVLFKV